MQYQQQNYSQSNSPPRNENNPYPPIQPYPAQPYPYPPMQPALNSNPQFPQMIQAPGLNNPYIPRNAPIHPFVIPQNIGVEAAMASARKWGTIIFIVSLLMTVF